jgi:hypothetical protein
MKTHLTKEQINTYIIDTMTQLLDSGAIDREDVKNLLVIRKTKGEYHCQMKVHIKFNEKEMYQLIEEQQKLKSLDSEISCEHDNNPF